LHSPTAFFIAILRWCFNRMHKKENGLAIIRKPKKRYLYGVQLWNVQRKSVEKLRSYKLLYKKQIVLHHSSIFLVNNEYLWTSGMVSDCKQEFTWCSINEKVPHSMNASLKCIAVDLNNYHIKTFNCNSKQYFACEVNQMTTWWFLI